MSAVCLFLTGMTYFFVFHVGGSASTNGYKSRPFHKPGLIWMDNMEGVVYFRHLYFDEINSRKKGHNVARTVKGRHDFTHIDVDYGNKTLFMSDAKTKSIMAMTFDPMGHGLYRPPWTLYHGTSAQVNGIAVDWTTDVVYWTDGMYDAIFGASVHLQNEAKIIVDNRNNPYGIATYPEKGFLFWTETGSRSRVMRSSLGGRHAKTILTFVDRVAYALHLDYKNERLYFTFTMGSTTGIQSYDLNGGGKDIPKSVKHNGFYLFDLDVYRDLLVSLEKRNNMSQVDVKFIERVGSENALVVQGAATGLKVLDQQRQNETQRNDCVQSTCPGICTNGLDRQCFCVDRLRSTVTPDVAKNYCGHYRFSGLLVNKGGGIFSMPTNFADLTPSSSVGQAEPQELIRSSAQITAMTSDIGTNRIYFYESRFKIIKSVSIAPDAQPEVLSMAAEEVGGLAFDSVGKNLYWTDTKRNHIMVVDKDGKYPIVLHEKLNIPSAIAIHASRKYRYLFWAEKNSTHRRRSIVWRSFLNGTSRELILGKLEVGYKGITGLAVDIVTNRLFICGRNSVWVSDLNGNNSHVVYSAPQPRRFTGITILHAPVLCVQKDRVWCIIRIEENVTYHNLPSRKGLPKRNDYLVLSDTHYKSCGLHAFDKNSLQNLTLVGKAVYKFYEHGNWFGVTYHHTSNQPKGSDLGVCSFRYNKCDQMCLAGKRRYARCACSIGYDSNATKCELDPPYTPWILVADQRYQRLFQIRHTPRSYVHIPVKAVEQPLSIAYDHVRRFKNQQKLSQVYWSDLETGTISRSYLDGSYQEVIVYDPSSYMTDLVLEPKLRLLFYISRTIGRLASLNVINVDTGLTKHILHEEFEDPTSIAVSDEYGYVFIVDDYKIWRSAMDGSFYEEILYDVHATKITVMENYLYFVNESKRTVVEPTWTRIVRSDINGDNVTVLVQLPTMDMISDLKADMNNIYWTNTKTRGVQVIPRKGRHDVSNIMPEDTLFLPSSLAVRVSGSDESKCAQVSCSGICLTTPYDNTTCDYDVVEGRIDTENTELCQIPVITYGEVVKNEVGRVVPNGYSATVECFPMHQISNEAPIWCINGTWSHIPNCYLAPEYKICGNVQKGYKVYNKSSMYFVYPEMTKVHVIVIGGGGGGYDRSNKDIRDAGKAGDGGNSSFGSHVATGGKGGTLTEGGEGGYGTFRGGDGSDPARGNCTTGGTAALSIPQEHGRPGSSFEIFAGAGGYSDACTDEHIKSATEKYSGPGGTDGNTQHAGYFGGGAGAKEGGAGGGGGWRRMTLSDLEPKTAVLIEVGAAGYPSYNRPGPGLVIVTWGGFQIDTEVNNNKDVFGPCLLNEN